MLVPRFQRSMEAAFRGNSHLTLTEANELLERFDLENRQGAFIVNATRVYDYFGLQWLIPFFECAQFQA